ncbi:hypothetical protein RND81_12G061900 [Saponaria officinalis]|uniref:CCHC-type domain-containing protein n=1 Tax=Saponaria officinalis TaxID=3572 RepID=A0AAW1H789_SAPOF
MVRPSGDQARREADVARMRRTEDAIIALANNANQAGGQQPQQQAIFEKFARHRPPTYDGKVGIATYYLHKEADNWWSISRAAIQAQPGFGWARFCEALKKRFYPDELKWQKEREFLRLEQGDLSVQEYADKFMEPSRFSTTIVPDEASRVRRFEKNLTPKVRTVLAGSPSVTFQQAYDRALSVYESVKAEEAETKRRNPSLSGILNVKRPFSPQSSYQETKKARFEPKPSVKAEEAETERRNPSLSGILNVKRPFSPQSSYQETKKARFEPKPSDNCTSGTPTMICYKCRKPYHPGKSCDGTPMLCFICKEPGHKAKDYPKKLPGVVRGPRSGSESQAQKGRIFVMTRAEAESHSNIHPGNCPE